MLLTTRPQVGFDLNQREEESAFSEAKYAITLSVSSRLNMMFGISLCALLNQTRTAIGVIPGICAMLSNVGACALGERIAPGATA